MTTAITLPEGPSCLSDVEQKKRPPMPGMTHSPHHSSTPPAAALPCPQILRTFRLPCLLHRVPLWCFLPLCSSALPSYSFPRMWTLTHCGAPCASTRIGRRRPHHKNRLPIVTVLGPLGAGLSPSRGLYWVPSRARMWPPPCPRTPPGLPGGLREHPEKAP
eukprot:8150-Pyramimonas_sp.AAC.2